MLVIFLLRRRLAASVWPAIWFLAAPSGNGSVFAILVHVDLVELHLDHLALASFPLWIL
jgi:hypothetical protein